MNQQVQFGLGTFGDVTVDENGAPLSQAQVIRNVVAEGVLADALGIDYFGVGEHHRDDFAISAPETVLAALAVATENIKLGSAVTVLSSDDPVRVYERFATVDALSNGRAEIILGRGSFTESFPLFGYNLADYETLFSEKLDLFAELITEGPITWKGTLRAPLNNQDVFPRTESGKLNTWIGVGGSPESVVRAARYGMPLVLAIIGGQPERFAPYAELFHRALAELGQPDLPIAVHSPGYITDSDDDVVDELWPHYSVMRDRIGRERGWPASTLEEFMGEVQHGSLYAGSPETVAQKMAKTISALGIQRFDMKYSAGTLPHEQMMRSIELYGTQVIPRVRELLADAS
ncbi:LLM class flavin-dependent oxidoreductase [Salinibacterium sp. TMP30]|uniref:LLM class flavin-dependent oxidoreductase n=1 Tax=Salinibacterium sp. TMP30 TaxID=3138237 RepID=UPI00313A4BED